MSFSSLASLSPTALFAVGPQDCVRGISEVDFSPFRPSIGTELRKKHTRYPIKMPVNAIEGLVVVINRRCAINRWVTPYGVKYARSI